MPKKSDVVIFPIPTDPTRGVRCNKENFYVDLLEDTHAGKKRWDLVLYSVKSKLLDYYRRGLKDPTSSLTLYDLVNFIADHRILGMLVTDSDGVLCAENK